MLTRWWLLHGMALAIFMAMVAMTTLRRNQTPTAQVYGPLQAAYDHFNQTLFGGQLPHCLITLQRKPRTYGYFSAKRFAAMEGDATVDEIAMNPAHFGCTPQKDTIGTLVHEMAHLWQEHFGSPPRSSYHDKQWAAKMIEIGLQPTDTGAPGGNITGYRSGDPLHSTRWRV